MPTLFAPLRMSLAALGGTGIFARALRGSALVMSDFAVSQILRLVSNLILTRLLVHDQPAFGKMTLVSVFMTGLAMFSDVGIGPSIQQSRRGDEPAFLNTAWTIQVVRGAILWLLTLVIAWPVATFYHQPDLMWLLPVAGLSLLIQGFSPTRIETANRHLLLGRVTTLNLTTQALSLLAMIGFALAFRSVWALVAGGVVSSLLRLALMHWFLPGPKNHFHWERAAADDLIHFGKWIFLSTMLAFLIAQGDKAILGRYLEAPNDSKEAMRLLGIYGIGTFLATSPLLLAGAVIAKVFLPIYREVNAAGTELARARLRRMRIGITATTLGLTLLLAYAGGWLVDVLYDPRWAMSGAVVVGLALASIVQTVGLTYDQAALAAGDSRGFFALFASRAVMQIGAFLTGLHFGGIGGAFIGQSLAMAVTHVLIIRLAWRHRVWDPVHDAVFLAAGIGLGAGALWMNRDLLGVLWSIGHA